jgi:prepilin-type N-terminal cleavage/methylation domain-containing protein/prepilin-type processing-associated H-X9-DG protein
MRQYPSQLSRRNAFTLIELLVVISIIALLIAILLPALGAAQQQAKSSQCLSQQRQIGIAMMAYVGDHDSYFMPYVTWITATKQRTPADLLIQGRYIPQDVQDTGGKGSKIFACPVGPDQYAATSSHNNDGLAYVHYGYNWRSLGGSKMPVPRIDQVLRASDMYMYMDSAANASFAKGMFRVNNHGPGTTAGTPHGRHMGQAVNILYVDGHVGTQRVESLIDPWADLGRWDQIGWWGGFTPKW